MPSVISTTNDVISLSMTAKSLSTKNKNPQENRRHGMGEFFAAGDASKVYSAAEHLTAPVAWPLLEHAGLIQKKITDSISILDLACGTGVLTALLKDHLKKTGTEDKVKITCSDISETQIGWIRRRIEEQGWSNTRAVVADATKSSLPSDNFDFVIIAMALMLIPDPRSTVKESMRMLKPGGTLAISTWLIEGWVPDTRAAIMAANLPGNPCWPTDSDELVAAWALGPWHRRVFVENTLRANGFVDVKTEVVTRHITIGNADEFCRIFRAFVRVVTDAYWTPKQREECLPLVEPAFREYFNEKYGEGKPFTVERTSIMASGRKPY